MPARILFVTGKGGTGKSSLSAALAGEAARRGLEALLVRMPDGATADAGPGGEASAVASGGARTRGPRAARVRIAEKTLDPGEELTAFLARLLPLSFLARRLTQSRTFSAVAHAAPGLADLVALSAVVAAAASRRGVVVVDGPSTGHAAALLAAPSRVLDVAGIGPVAAEARRCVEVLASPKRFVAVLLTTAEELAILELRSLRDAMAPAGVAASTAVVNALWPLRAGAADAARILASNAPKDAFRHLRLGRRQEALVAALERDVGPCSRIGFALDAQSEHAGLPASDVASLFDRLAGRVA